MKNKMKFDLENKEWKEFVFEDFFEINSTTSGIDRNKLIARLGQYPYLTRTEKNNGYDAFICTQSEKYSLDSSNVITIGLDTQTVFYQPFRFYTGQNIQILKCKRLNKDIAQFLIPLIKSQMTKFNWGGNGATLTRLRRSKIVIPVNSKEEPDFEFMESFMKHKEQEKLNQYKSYIKKRLQEIEGYKKVEPIETKEFAEFELGSLFKLIPGKSKGLNHLKESNKGVNYLGATNLNNGVLAYVSSTDNSKLIQKGNSIAFIRNGEGSMGYSVYKAEDFIATSDISVGYSDVLNREIGLFITTIADKVRGKYNFGYKRNATRLKKEKLLLPINEKGNPDYEYMENFMKQLEYEKLHKYLEIKNNERPTICISNAE